MRSYEEYKEIAKRVRINTLKCHYHSKSSHIGSGYSCIDILVVLYGGWLNIKPDNPDDPNRDRFILSKGHAAAAYYSVLAEFNFIPKEWLDSYCQFGSKLGGHVSHTVPGVEFSTGSLGHGLPVGVGMALGAKLSGKSYKVVVLMSDGELNSGANWEAILFAQAHKLDNLLIIIDRNRIQGLGFTEDIIPLEDIEGKFKAFGCAVERINGHDFIEIERTLQKFPFVSGKPSVIIAETVKGKGVHFMENKIEWHYKSPNEEEFNKALEELESQ